MAGHSNYGYGLAEGAGGNSLNNWRHLRRCRSCTATRAGSIGADGGALRLICPELCPSSSVSVATTCMYVKDTSVMLAPKQAKRCLGFQSTRLQLFIDRPAQTRVVDHSVRSSVCFCATWCSFAAFHAGPSGPSEHALLQKHSTDSSMSQRENFVFWLPYSVPHKKMFGLSIVLGWRTEIVILTQRVQVPNI